MNPPWPADSGVRLAGVPTSSGSAVKIVVTGGAGFIGSTYVRHLLGGDPAFALPGRAEVVVLDAFTYAGDRSNLAALLDAPRLTVVEGDICDRDVVDVALAGADAVVHFAAESHVDR